MVSHNTPDNGKAMILPTKGPIRSIIMTKATACVIPDRAIVLMILLSNGGDHTPSMAIMAG